MSVEIFRGDNQTLEVTVNDSANNAFDLTGSVARFTVREGINTTQLIFKTSDEVTEIEITDPVDGVLEIYLLPEDTREMKPGLYVYDVEVELPSGDIHTVISGAFRIKGDVTYEE